jgi:hypothetical protein
MTANPGDPELLETGERQYAGLVTSPDRVKLWYTPAQTIEPEIISLANGVPQLLSGGSDDRKFVDVRNLSGSGGPTLWIGSKSVKPGAGWPVYAGEGKSYKQDEFVGDLWGVPDGDMLCVVVAPTADR